MNDALFRRFAQCWLVAMLLLPIAAQSLDFSMGLRAYRVGDYKRAAAIWRELGEAGDAFAQGALAGLYFKGEGVKQDFVESTRWFRRAAEQGHALAQFNLGNAYQRGLGVEKDDRQTSKWWRLAAEQDVAAAQFNLALNYYYGRGVEQDVSAADQWMRRAADNGHARAQELLAKSGPGTVGKADPSVAPARAPDVEQDPVQPAPLPVLSGTPRAEVARVQLHWIGQQAPGHFTLQLLVSSSAQGANAVMREHAFEAPVAVFDYTSKEGLARFAVLHGSYPTRIAAQRAIATLPPTLGKLEPLIRRFSSVQAQMDK